jgi:hypothetical protein
MRTLVTKRHAIASMDVLTRELDCFVGRRFVLVHEHVQV